MDCAIFAVKTGIKHHFNYCYHISAPIICGVLYLCRRNNCKLPLTTTILPCPSRMLRYILLPFLSLLVWSCSCQPSGINATLAEAERLMDARPDSALALVESVDPSAIHSRSTRALHALLLTQAQFKNYIDVPNDSLISIAVDYYDENEDSHYSMLAHHYCGAINSHMNKYSKGLMHLLKAHNYAVMLDDKFWIAITARELSYVYRETYNAYESQRFAEISLENFRYTRKQSHIDYATLDFAGSCITVGDYKQAISILRGLIESSNKGEDLELNLEARRTLGLAYLNSKDYAEARPCYEDICKMPSNIVELSDSLYLLLSYLRLKDMSSALNLSSKCSDLSDGLGNWMQYEIYEALDSLPQAMETLKKMDHETDSILRYMLTSNISGTLLDYYDSQKELQEARLKITHVIAWSIGIIGLLLSGVCTLLFYQYRKKQKNIINRNVGIAENLREMISIKDREAQEKIQNLLAERFNVLDNLCRILYEKGNSSLARKQISNEIDSLIKQFSTDKVKLAELSDYVNKNCDGIMDKLKSDFPEMKDLDYRLFLYSVLGFSNSVIAMFLGEEKITAIYARRKRLKNKFKDLSSEYKDDYIKAIS